MCNIMQEMVDVAARMVWLSVEALAGLFKRAIRSLKDKTDGK